MRRQSSLFDSPGFSPVADSPGWAAELLTGSLATGLAVLAIAILGFLALGGRVPLRQGALAVVGIFLLFSAAEVANVSDIARGESDWSRQEVYRAPLTPAPAATEYNPFADPSQRER